MRIRVLTIALVSFFCLAANNCCVSSDANAISNDLKKIERDIPLPYHEGLAEGISHYKSELMPATFIENEAFMETELRRRGMPAELKYLPVALTEMRSDYQKGDCRGVWALPTLVALRYSLTVDADNDERLSIETSTGAALSYLSELYELYEDWWMSILAFSNSPNSVQGALVRSDKFLDLWDFYDDDLLPNVRVIRDFIACDYVYSAYTPEQQAEALAEGKKMEAQRQAEEARKALEAEKKKADSIAQPKPQKPKETFTTYTIKRGDNLGKIARKYHVTVDSLMKWNNLKSDFIREGDTLKIKK